MNVGQAPHLSRQGPQQMNQVVGGNGGSNGVVGADGMPLPQHQQMQDNNAMGLATGMDNQFVLMRNSMREKIKMDHACVTPRSLSYDLLNEITNGFSEERKLGSGAYGKVYKGVHKDGETIAVKLLYDMPGLDDEQFKREFNNLMCLQHHNIVRLVGFCHDTRQEYVHYNGRLVVADKIYRALCFEYAHNGSLHENLSDEYNGHDWRTRYGIIEGICKGLKYLHHELKPPMYHLDLKPANVLLDENMVPKLADFGLSRLFGEEQTKITKSSIGTRGYLPPEYIEQNVISNKFDIFSLGVVIIKVMAGPMGYSKWAEMSSSEFIELVHGNWRARLQAPPMYEPEPEAYYEQIKTCIEIALMCVEVNRHKRPSIRDIVDKMNETQTRIQLWSPLSQKVQSVPNRLKTGPALPNVTEHEIHKASNPNVNPEFVLQETHPELLEQNKKTTDRNVSTTRHNVIPGVSSERANIDGVLSMLCSPDPEEQRSAAAELRLLAKRNAHNRLCIAEAGAIPLLLSLLSSSDLRTQEHAVTALLNLSIHEDNKASIMSSGAVPSVVHVLKNGSMEARENAAATLFSLSVVDEYKVQIGGTGAIPALVVLLSEGSQRGKKDAAAALFNLCIYQGNKGRAIRAGLVPLIMGLVTNHTGALIEEATAILSILSSHQEGKAAIGAAEHIPALVELIGNGSPRNRENAAAVMLHLCIGEQQLVHLTRAHECGIMVPLRELALNGTERGKRKAVQLLERMSRFLVQQQEEQESHSRAQAASAQVLPQPPEQVQENEIPDQLDSPASQYPILFELFYDDWHGM